MLGVSSFGLDVLECVLNDYELATRLSYFLWSSMPDDGLFAAAQGGKLNGEMLQKEVDRLLVDSKANRFVDDFARQWLQLHRLGMFPHCCIGPPRSKSLLRGPAAAPRAALRLLRCPGSELDQRRSQAGGDSKRPGVDQH